MSNLKETDDKIISWQKNIKKLEFGWRNVIYNVKTASEICNSEK